MANKHQRLISDRARIAKDVQESDTLRDNLHAIERVLGIVATGLHQTDKEMREIPFGENAWHELAGEFARYHTTIAVLSGFLHALAITQGIDKGEQV